MNNIGVDLGNANVNTSEGIEFESKIKTGIINMNESDLKVIFEGLDYTVGAIDGSPNISKKRHKKLAYKISLLTAIAKSYAIKNIKCNVVVGVPVEWFNDQELKNDIKETILSWGPQKITVNGTEKTINIENADIFCESAIVFQDREKFKKEKTLVVDCGGSTIDVSFWDGLNLLYARTYKDGMISLYGNVAKAINSKYKTDIAAYIAKECVGKETFEINQELKDIKFVDAVVQNYVDGLTSYINQEFEVDAATSIQLIGGGAIQLAEKLQDEYEKAILNEDAAFANANTYKKVADVLWT